MSVHLRKCLPFVDALAVGGGASTGAQTASPVSSHVLFGTPMCALVGGNGIDRGGGNGVGGGRYRARCCRRRRIAPVRSAAVPPPPRAHAWCQPLGRPWGGPGRRSPTAAAVVAQRLPTTLQQWRRLTAAAVLAEAAVNMADAFAVGPHVLPRPLHVRQRGVSHQLPRVSVGRRERPRDGDGELRGKPVTVVAGEGGGRGWYGPGLCRHRLAWQAPARPVATAATVAAAATVAVSARNGERVGGRRWGRRRPSRQRPTSPPASTRASWAAPSASQQPWRCLSLESRCSVAGRPAAFVCCPCRVPLGGAILWLVTRNFGAARGRGH